MNKYFALLLIIFFLCGCAKIQRFHTWDRELKKNLVEAIKYRKTLGGRQQEEILNEFGYPDKIEKYCPYFYDLQIWHYRPFQCCKGLHLAFVEDIVRDVGYW